jgi:hypothetical protein
MQALLRQRLREHRPRRDAPTSTSSRWSRCSIAASVRDPPCSAAAGQGRRLLQNIARGAIDAARRCYRETTKGSRSCPSTSESGSGAEASCARHLQWPRNNHDLEGISEDILPGRGHALQPPASFPSAARTIRWAHGYIGLTEAAGAFGGLTNVIDAEHFTDTEIVIEGTARAAGTPGEFLGCPADGAAEVELPFVAFNRFDEEEGALTIRERSAW